MSWCRTDITGRVVVSKKTNVPAIQRSVLRIYLPHRVSSRSRSTDRSRTCHLNVPARPWRLGAAGLAARTPTCNFRPPCMLACSDRYHCLAGYRAAPPILYTRTTSPTHVTLLDTPHKGRSTSFCSSHSSRDRDGRVVVWALGSTTRPMTLLIQNRDFDSSCSGLRVFGGALGNMNDCDLDGEGGSI